MKKYVLSLVSFIVIFSVVFCNVFVTSASNVVGDVNGDGKANSVDALMVLKQSVGLASGIKDLKSADINHDGKVDSYDALIILRLSVGLANPKDYTTTTAKPATTKPIQFTPANVKEVSPSSVTHYAGTIQRAWRISSKTTNVEIHKVAYGSKITQNFVKSQDSAMDVSSKKVTYQPICNIAIVTCAPTTLKYAVTANVLGTTKGKQEDISKKVGALMAVNGESTSAARAMAIRNGKVHMPNGDEREVMRLYNNGKCDYGSLTKQNQNQLIKDGVYNTVRFHYVLVKNGKKINNNESYYHNRTVVAQISATKYILAVSEFMPMNSIADLLMKYGAKNAVVINGGNCSFMYVRGIGNVTGTKATQLKNLNKVNVVETEFFANNGMLGLNNAGKPKLGGPCSDEVNSVYVT